MASLCQCPITCLWCMYAAWCVLLVSFNNQAAESVISIPEYRKVFGSLAIIGSLAMMDFVATTNALFFGGKFLNGFAVGAIASVTVTYIDEVTPLALRGFFTCLNALAFCLTSLVAVLITNETENFHTRWAYCAVFCARYGFAVIVWFMPDKRQKRRRSKALKGLNKLGQRGTEATSKLALTQRTLEEARH
ncbi:uncharacterized protein BCR38DRAFT_411983 [Pseudomassariella vexata]|uniref:Major facilitator superfamily (MFS) profile domain-containing protein n=1 Tax=Pseudomassariella vexata TaxID=1141098 RepID=A0A1Y2DNK1_9PEZI|nr:uncharacterized protein BCR38DRAFT_411983 [Pseudomassariella vexata]ORY60873.1 hypothetical protein BCR38DRAFT_411983 [Pseudomassariella vexata]